MNEKVMTRNMLANYFHYNKQYFASYLEYRYLTGTKHLSLEDYLLLDPKRLNDYLLNMDIYETAFKRGADQSDHDCYSFLSYCDAMGLFPYDPKFLEKYKTCEYCQFSQEVSCNNQEKLMCGSEDVNSDYSCDSFYFSTAKTQKLLKRLKK